MSRYFERLAQRTGLIGGRSNAPAGVARSDSNADIVEQDNYVDAPSAPPAATAPHISAAGRVSTQRSAAPELIEPARPRADDTADAIGLPEPQRATAPADDRATAPRRRAAEARRRNPSRPETPDRSSPPAPTERSMPRDIETEDAPAIASRHTDRGTQPLADMPPSARTASPPARESLPARAMESKRAPEKPRDESTAGNESSERYGAANAPRPFSESLSSPSRGLNSAVRVAAPALANAPLSPPSREKNVDVRIGAVRLEIHTSSAPLPGTPEPRSAPAAEPPRFRPSRYHLRG